MRPVEGTILTVVRETAEAVEALDGDRRSSRCSSARATPRATSVAAHARAPARRCATPASSTRAARASRCCSPRCSRSSTAARSPSPRLVDDAARRSPRTSRATTSRALRYEVMYLLDAHDDTMPAFRDAWGAIGDSIVVVGGDGLWNCHVHTNDIGGAVEAGIDAGRPRKIRITDLIEQVEEERWVREAEVRRRPRRVRRPGRRHHRGRRGRRRRRRPPPAHEPRRAAGRRRRAVDEPVDRADPRGGRGVHGRRGHRAAEQQEHRAGRAAGRRAHRQAGRRRRRRTSVPEALAALVEYDPNAELDDERATMQRRARTRAHRRGHPGGARRVGRRRARSREGDWIALVARRRRRRAPARRPTRCASCSARSSTTTARSSPCSSAATRAANETERIREHIEFTFPHLEVEFHDGGQPLYPYLVGVE